MLEYMHLCNRVVVGLIARVFPSPLSEIPTYGLNYVVVLSKKPPVLYGILLFPKPEIVQGVF
jgi:hypothetical protein